MVKELEARVHQLTMEAESSNLQHQKLSHEKSNLEQLYRAACTELQEAKTRYSMKCLGFISISQGIQFHTFKKTLFLKSVFFIHLLIIFVLTFSIFYFT